MTTPPAIPDNKEANAKSHVLFRLISELAFVLLPLVVVSLVWSGRGNPIKAMSSPEWSFGSCVLFGQATVKVALGCVIDRNRINVGKMSLLVTLLVVLGIVPSSIILFQLVDVDSPPSNVVIEQGIWFVLSLVAYLWFGGLGEYKIALRKS